MDIHTQANYISLVPPFFNLNYSKIPTDDAAFYSAIPDSTSKSILPPWTTNTHFFLPVKLIGTNNLGPEGDLPFPISVETWGYGVGIHCASIEERAKDDRENRSEEECTGQ